LDLVGVLLRVDFLEEFQADDAVVGRFVVRDEFAADRRGLRVDVRDAFGVEDFVDTVFAEKGVFVRDWLFFFTREESG
jgi:hypothetical protein